MSNYQEVVGLLVYIFHAAALMSPVQSEKTSIQTHSKESSDVSYMGFDVEEEDSDEEEVWLFCYSFLFSFVFNGVRLKNITGLYL